MFKRRHFFITYKNNTVSFCASAAAAAGRVPDGGIKIAIEKDYCAIRDDLIFVITDPFPNLCRRARTARSRALSSRLERRPFIRKLNR